MIKYINDCINLDYVTLQQEVDFDEFPAEVSTCASWDEELGWHDPLDYLDYQSKPKEKYLREVINNRPVTVFIKRDLGGVLTKKSITKIHSSRLPWKSIICSDFCHLSRIFTAFHPKLIIIHADMLVEKNISIDSLSNMSNSLSNLTTKNDRIPIAIGIDPTTNYNLVNELKMSGICGIYLTVAGFGVKKSLISKYELINNSSYWPEDIIDDLPKDAKKYLVKNANGINLTPRQTEVFDLICNRGISNKQIAKTLNVSESAVKIHVSGILKKYRLKTRCQLSAFSRSSKNV